MSQKSRTRRAGQSPNFYVTLEAPEFRLVPPMPTSNQLRLCRHFTFVDHEAPTLCLLANARDR